CPKSFSRKRATCLVVNQTDQIQFVGHRREMPTSGLPSQKKSTVVHDRNCAIEATRRTMNTQRTVNSVLTVCLTSGGRFNCWRLSFSFVTKLSWLPQAAASSLVKKNSHSAG